MCTDLIEHAKAGPNAMRPQELCSACEMCNDHGRTMKLYQETQHPAGCHVLSSPSWACTRLSLLACLPTASKHRDSGLLISMHAYGNNGTHINARTSKIQKRLFFNYLEFVSELQDMNSFFGIVSNRNPGIRAEYRVFLNFFLKFCWVR